MSINESIQRAENVLPESLLEQQEGVDDRTGKGTSAEMLIEERVIRPHLPAPFLCQKGSVIAAATPSEQSAAIDRIVYDPTIAPPLVYGAAHSIFPIEAVAGLVEITMRLNARKLRQDVQRIAPIQNLRRRRYIVPVPNSITQAQRNEIDALSPRGFLIGLPEDPTWRPQTIANVIREAQLAAAGHVKITGCTSSESGTFPRFRRLTTHLLIEYARGPTLLGSFDLLTTSGRRFSDGRA
jgi:hypothetical protein